MNLFSSFVPKERFVKGLQELSHIDFSLFNDYRPTYEELSLSPINIFIAGEPNEYFGNHDWIIQNKENFSIILTWSDKILNSCDNAYFCPYGESWWFDNHYEYTPIEKEFKVSFLRGAKLQATGHVIRHEIYNKQKDITTPTQFWDTLGRTDIYEEIRDTKMQSFLPYMFSLCIENNAHNGYFTEKITDCILSKTIPLYWGCKNINEFYNEKGIIRFNTVDEAIDIINNLTKNDYYNRLDYIEENYNKAFEYKDYINTIKNKVVEIFAYNKII